uniref:XPG N-terminal domain-containing protein n=1 Tax=Arcella intermedia TaxID=1963864 RepID=A0A6B2L1U0_9EUKA
MSLQHSRIGIQVDYWLKDLNANVNEPFHVAVGGVPLSLFKIISTQLEIFRRNNIKPVFLFNGLNILRTDKPFSKPDHSAAMREKGWDFYLKGDLQSATTQFAAGEKYTGTHFIPNIIKFLRDCNVETFTAPYQARAQLAYFYQEGSLINGVYGGLELLMFGVPSVIFDIDFKHQVFTSVDFNAIMNDLQITWDQFVEVCILAGFDLAQTFPPIADHQENSWEAAYELIKIFGNGYNIIQNFQSQSPQLARANYLETFLRAKCLVEYHIIMDRSGKCRSLIPRGFPKDLHELVGPRMPDQVYYLISQNIISPQVVNNLASGVMVENCPFVDSQRYRETVINLTSLRTLILGILSSNLNGYHKNRKVITVRWYDPNSEVLMEHASEKVQSKLRKLLPPIFENEINQELSRQRRLGMKEMDFAFILNLIEHRKETAILNLETNPEKKEMSTPIEFYGTTLLHTLQILKFVKNGELTPYGKMLKNVDQRYQEPVIILIDLLREGHLNGDRLITSQSQREFTLLIYLL